SPPQAGPPVAATSSARRPSRTPRRRPGCRCTRARPSGRARAAARAPGTRPGRGPGLRLHEVETVRSGPGADTLAANAPDLLIVVAYGEILPQAVLDLAAIAPVKLDFSLPPELPRSS